MCAINDLLGQPHSPTSKMVLFCEILKSGGRKDGQASHVKIVITTGRLWDGLVDQ